MRAACPRDRPSTSAWFAPTRTRIADGSTTSRMREPGPHFFAFLHLGHRAVLPDGLEDDEAVERRGDAHLVGVLARVLPRVRRAIALNLENPQVGGLGALAQLEGHAELREARLASSRVCTFFSAIVLATRSLPMTPSSAIRRSFAACFSCVSRMARAERCSPRFLLICSSRSRYSASRSRAFFSCDCAVELDQQVAALDHGASRHQAHDDQLARGNPWCWRGPGQPRDRDRVAAHRFDEPVEADDVRRRICRCAVLGWDRRCGQRPGEQRSARDPATSCRPTVHHSNRPPRSPPNLSH